MYNQGVNCYMNSLLQALVSLGPLQKKIAEYKNELERNQVGRLMLDLIRDAHTRDSAWDGAPSVVRAMQMELSRQGRKTTFGQGEESASEGFVFLIETLDRIVREQTGKKKEPFAELFDNEYWRVQKCPDCGKERERRINNSFIDLFGMPREIMDDRNIGKFERWIEKHRDPIEDYQCTSRQCRENKEGTKLRARLELEFAPPILLLCFGAYRAYGQEPHDWWFPRELTLRAQCTMTYRAVALVEHSGSLAGGHYWAKCLRHPPDSSPNSPPDSPPGDEPVAYMLNDLSVLELPMLVGSSSSYLVWFVLSTST